MVFDDKSKYHFVWMLGSFSVFYVFVCLAIEVTIFNVKMSEISWCCKQQSNCTLKVDCNLKYTWGIWNSLTIREREREGR